MRGFLVFLGCLIFSGLIAFCVWLSGYRSPPRRPQPPCKKECCRRDAPKFKTGVVHALTDGTFENFLAKAVAQKRAVIVEFYSETCAPCRAFAPKFSGLAKLRPDAIFAKVNVVASPRTARLFGVNSVPAVFGFRAPGDRERLETNARAIVRFLDR